MDFPLVLIAIGLGIATAALAKRYNRSPFVWGVFGTLLFIIAVPLLLLKGPDDELRRAAVVRRRNRARDFPANWTIAKRRIAEALDEVHVADFDTLLARTRLHEGDLARAIDHMLDDDELTTTSDGFLLAGKLRSPGQHLPGTAAPVAEKRQEPAPVAADAAERLRRLTELHAEGLVADDEYAAKRKSILDEL